jgi:hypothetical protein
VCYLKKKKKRKHSRFFHVLFVRLKRSVDDPCVHIVIPMERFRSTCMCVLSLRIYARKSPLRTVYMHAEFKYQTNRETLLYARETISRTRRVDNTEWTVFIYFIEIIFHATGEIQPYPMNRRSAWGRFFWQIDL